MRVPVFCFAKARRVFLYLAFALICVTVAHPAFAQVPLNDTEFNYPDDWSTFGPYRNPESAMNPMLIVEQELVGGNAGPYLKATLTSATVPMGSSVSTWAALVNNTLTYDPDDMNDGPIANIDFTIDARRPAGTLQRAISIVVAQGEFVWMAVDKRVFLGVAGHTDDWNLLAINHLVQDDFVPLPGSQFEVMNQPDHPDFSDMGGELTFGVGFGLSCPTSSDCTVGVPKVHDFDNLAVRVWSESLPGEFYFEAEDAAISITEGDAPVDVAVGRRRGSGGEVTVDYATEAQTASEGGDYEAATGTLTFVDSDKQESIELTVLDDAAPENTETFLVRLSNPTGGAILGPDPVLTASINDDSNDLADLRLEAPIITRTEDNNDVRGDVTLDFPLRYWVRGRVVNDGPADSSDIRVRVLMPKLALAAYDVPVGTVGGDECIIDAASDPNVVIVDCIVRGTLASGDSVDIPAGDILVGYAETVRIEDIEEPTYSVSITRSSPRDPDNSNDTLAEEPDWDQIAAILTGGSSGGGCFIATAAYGSYLDPEVWVLRRFRDDWLLTNGPGRAFVAWYYAHSPRYAAVIAQHESLRALTRAALTPVVYSAKYPVLVPAMLLLIALTRYRRRSR
jgi:hypothetical protein